MLRKSSSLSAITSLTVAVARKTPALFAIACLIAAAMPLLCAPATLSAPTDFPGWPTHYEGKTLQPLPLTSLERRFAENFPGRVGRFTDGEREIVMRWVSSETRKLHPAADCFRGSGYTIAPTPIDVDSSGARWGTFLATRGAERIHVRERIYDLAGNGWTDVSSWYWAALRQRSLRPWWAVTVATSFGAGNSLLSGAAFPVDQDESNARDVIRTVGPGVIGAALNENVAGP